jgi:four helix bundle protein
MEGVAAMKDFRNLTVWEKAHELVLESYKATTNYPRSEMFGLTSQIRRAAVSIPANISEGCGKRGNAEFQRFLNIANGSASELEYHFLLSRDLHFIENSSYEHLNASIVEVKRMLSALIRKIEVERVTS